MSELSGCSLSRISTQIKPQTSITDAEGHTKTYAYSADYSYAYVTSITNDLNNTLSVSYDFDTGCITSVTTRNGDISTYEYDLLGRITKKINPDGIGRLTSIEWYNSGQLCATETRAYDYLGNIVTKIDPGGNIYTYEYDSKGQPTQNTGFTKAFQKTHTIAMG
ncbi:MAG: RHS repeat protein [Candidatus Methanofastidiosia archaeon]|jgi:YD repeat-containing protein